MRLGAGCISTGLCRVRHGQAGDGLGLRFGERRTGGAAAQVEVQAQRRFCDGFGSSAGLGQHHGFDDLGVAEGLRLRRGARMQGRAQVVEFAKAAGFRAGLNHLDAVEALQFDLRQAVRQFGHWGLGLDVEHELGASGGAGSIDFDDLGLRLGSGLSGGGSFGTRRSLGQSFKRDVERSSSTQRQQFTVQAQRIGAGRSGAEADMPGCAPPIWARQCAR